MIKSNVAFLYELSIEDIIQNINDVFAKLVKKCSEYLDLKYERFNVHAIYLKTNEPDSKLNPEKIFHFGVRKKKENGNLVIEIISNYKRFIHFILLREAFYLFIPNELKNNNLVLIGINLIIEEISKGYKETINWKLFIRNNLDSKTLNYLNEISSFKNLIQKSVPEDKLNYIQYFFHFIRNNYNVKFFDIKRFYSRFFEDFNSNISDFIFSDDIVETLRILIKIFYKVKNYRIFSEYQELFKKFKQEGFIKTNLTFNSFIYSVRWLNKYTYISPSYQINWKAINVSLNICFLRFHPNLKINQIKKVIDKFPFLISPKTSNLHTFLGYIVLPREYQEDLINLLKKLEENNYIVEKYLLEIDKYSLFVNLNYFREVFHNTSIINVKSPNYDKKYEIEFYIEYPNEFHKAKLSLLDFLILDKIRFFSISGFSFIRRSKILTDFKDELLAEQRFHENNISKLRNQYLILSKDMELKNSFLTFLDKNEHLDFFSTLELIENLNNALKISYSFLQENPLIKNEKQFFEFVKKYGISNSLEENILFKNNLVKIFIYKKAIPLYFDSNKEFIRMMKKYEMFNELLKISLVLKIFDLKIIRQIIENPQVINSLYKIKQQKIKSLYNQLSKREIIYEDINQNINDFLKRDPPLIKPLFINTIFNLTAYKNYIILLLEGNLEVMQKIKEIKSFFPCIFFYETKEVFLGKTIIYLEIFFTNLIKQDKEKLVSMIYSTFRKYILHGDRFIYPGYIPYFSLKEFYDLVQQRFYYSPKLFEEYYIFVKETLKSKFARINDKFSHQQERYWRFRNSFKSLNPRSFRLPQKLHYNFSLSEIEEIRNLSENVEHYLNNVNQLFQLGKEDFFKKYILSIKFKPNFPAFGFDQYYMFIRLNNLDEINMKILLTNKFQQLKLTPSIGRGQFFHIKYIFPRDNPNKSYVNWLLKTKKISEFFLFKIKKLFFTIQLDKNLYYQGFKVNITDFEDHVQKVLFSNKYDYVLKGLRTFDFSDAPKENCLGPDSKFFKILAKYYNRTSINIKELLNLRMTNILKDISDLLKENMIFPYITLKNTNLRENITIILPDLNEHKIRKLIKIFNFFNVIKIYEIEGEYFKFQFEKKRYFVRGLMIKIFLPNMELNSLFQVFYQIFNFLEIEWFQIITDLFDGNFILKKEFGGSFSFKKYNPLLNFRWNEKDKIWMKDKLFDRYFRPIIPRLDPKIILKNVSKS